MIFTFQFVQPILQTITHLIQYPVLGIHFWCVKCTTARYPKIRAFPFLPIKRCNQLQWLDYMKTNDLQMLLNVFGITYTYWNCTVFDSRFEWIDEWFIIAIWKALKSTIDVKKVNVLFVSKSWEICGCTRPF